MANEYATREGIIKASSRCLLSSIAVSGGDSLYLIGKVLGHRQSRTTERYAHLKDDPLRAVANRTSERIAAIMQGGRDTKVVPVPSAKASGE